MFQWYSIVIVRVWEINVSLKSMKRTDILLELLPLTFVFLFFLYNIPLLPLAIWPYPPFSHLVILFLSLLSYIHISCLLRCAFLPFINPSPFPNPAFTHLVILSLLFQLTSIFLTPAMCSCISSTLSLHPPYSNIAGNIKLSLTITIFLLCCRYVLFHFPYLYESDRCSNQSYRSKPLLSCPI